MVLKGCYSFFLNEFWGGYCEMGLVGENTPGAHTKKPVHMTMKANDQSIGIRENDDVTIRYDLPGVCLSPLFFCLLANHDQ